ncbi:MAG: dihydroxyacetone kinase subunit L [Selenomonas sp.]|uniref:dihydroxyacetone kinase subunit DhaL n=1 Tax=Selenomonas sp. TaxID=2053611 RepID=UPI0025D7913F|nr:dihydroxyacetone kinase subunit DhaL [Selenomonas sp.]MCR5758475.1 dihydroxyacetone kinase subunit L [Selenomonas sp.]
MSRIKDAFDAVAVAIIAQKDYLSDIDAKAGDGDHGLNMARGFRAAQEIVDEMEDTSKPGPVLKKIGKALVQNVGGAAGPLYGAAFVKAGEACDDETAMNVRSFEKLLAVAIEAIQTRGRAEKGDKTILDALIPIHDCFLPENVEDKTLFEVLQEASKAAGDGVNYTKEIPAKKGRASLVGERSIGVEDPGAVSTMLMYRALYQFLKR